MGIGPSYKSCYTHPTATIPNPNPLKFKVLAYSLFPPYLIVLVEYVGCTNFEGKKIMIYKNVFLTEILHAKSLDPHFQDQRFSPIVRLSPGEEGWQMGCDICRFLQTKDRT